MANEAQELLRMSGGWTSNTGPQAQWAQALARAIDDGATTAEVIDKLRAAGIPIGSAFGQWALAASLDIESGVGNHNTQDLTRAIGAEYQKPPAGDVAFQQEVANGLSRLPQ